MLLRGLACQFSDITDIKGIKVEVAPNQEVMIRIEQYRFTYHAYLGAGEVSVDEVRQKEVQKLGFLRRLLIEELEGAEKIFVRKGERSGTIAEILMLLAALRAYGPCTLLWVTETDVLEDVGTVRVIAPGLLHGVIDRFAPYVDAHSNNFTAWIDLCRSAYVLEMQQAAPGSCIRPSRRPDASINLLDVTTLAGRHPASQPLWKVAGICNPPSARTGFAIEHRVIHAEQNGPVFVSIDLPGLPSGKQYTFSTWIYVSSIIGLEKAELQFPGLPSTRIRRADLGKRGCWQRLEVSAHVPDAVTCFTIEMHVVGEDGALFKTVGWHLNEGITVESSFQPNSLANNGGHFLNKTLQSDYCETIALDVVDIPVTYLGWPVLKHKLIEDTNQHTGIVFTQRIGNIASGKIHSGTVKIWLEHTFSGTEVSLVLDGQASLVVGRANLEVRNEWQEISILAACPLDVPEISLNLYIVAEKGSSLYSTKWSFYSCYLQEHKTNLSSTVLQQVMARE